MPNAVPALLFRPRAMRSVVDGCKVILSYTSLPYRSTNEQSSLTFCWRASVHQATAGRHLIHSEREREGSIDLPTHMKMSCVEQKSGIQDCNHNRLRNKFILVGVENNYRDTSRVYKRIRLISRRG